MKEEMNELNQETLRHKKKQRTRGNKYEIHDNGKEILMNQFPKQSQSSEWWEVLTILCMNTRLQNTSNAYFEAASDTKLCTLALQSIRFPVFGRNLLMFLNVESCMVT